MKGLIGQMNLENEMIVNRYQYHPQSPSRRTRLKCILKKYRLENLLKKCGLYDLGRTVLNFWTDGKSKSHAENFIRTCCEDETLLPQFIEIETLNRCNGTCPFCPVNKNADTRHYKVMEKELFVSIISQLRELNFTGRVGLYSNNEPFLDQRISEFAKIAKENLPDAYIHLYTNGTLLTLEKFLSIIPFLDRIIIDNYNDNLELNETSKIIYEYCEKNSLYKEKVQIHLRKLNEVLFTRGGQAPNNTKKRTLKIPCILPFIQVVIRPDGKLSLCCNDALGKFTLGDLNKQSLLEIWQSDNYRDIRRKTQKGRAEISLCQFCDSRWGP